MTGLRLGILGSGQLGRMTALAAYPLGARVHVYAPDEGPATQVAPSTQAAWDDLDALRRFADGTDVITLEWENVPATVLDALTDHGARVAPGAHALRTCQDRVDEKAFLARVGVPTTPWAAVTTAADVAAFLALHGQAILKTRRAGYDGRGQRRVRTPHAANDASAAPELTPDGPSICEAVVDFACELSVMVARRADGEAVTWEPSRNEHADHILRVSHVPSGLPPDVLDQARATALAIAAALDYVGVLGVELFLTRDGRLLVNELAPRPHNSGHWTMDAGCCSQFEQLVRAVSGMPLGPTERWRDVTMINLIGDDVDDVPRWLADPTARVHLYGKQVRAKRKMGHVNRVRPR